MPPGLYMETLDENTARARASQVLLMNLMPTF